MQRQHRASRLRSRVILTVLLGAPTTLAVAWASALWVIPQEVPDPYAEPTAFGSADFVYYYMRLGPSHPPPLEEGRSRRLPPEVTSESIASIHMFLSAQNHSDNYGRGWCFTHRVFAGPGRDRIALSGYGAFWGLSDEFFSIRDARYAPPEVFSLAVEQLGSPPWPSHPPTVLIERAGWPFRAFWGKVRIQEPLPSDLRFVDGEWSITFPHKGTPADYVRWLVPRPSSIASEAAYRFLPARPLWAGLVGNTLFFAGAWSLVLFGPVVIRRYLRRRRNLCPRCAYNLSATPSDSPCPECGIPRVQLR
jgi:hypothetical protein